MTLSSRWVRRDNALCADVTLADFAEVQALVSALMALAERLDHHPEVRFGYRQVAVAWTTHDAGGVTARDEAAAAETDRLIAQYLPG